MDLNGDGFVTKSEMLNASTRGSRRYNCTVSYSKKYTHFNSPVNSDIVLNCHYLRSCDVPLSTNTITINVLFMTTKHAFGKN